MLAAAVTLLPSSANTFIGSGPAATYDPSYSRADWDAIYWKHAEWRGTAGPPAGWGEYHCAHASYDTVGVRLRLVSGGREYICVISDTVQAAHKDQWWAKWGIEGSHELFTALADPSYVEVYDYYTVEPEPEPSIRHFESTGHALSNGFLDFWIFNGGLPIFGLPLSGEYDCELETGERGVCQITERARFELHPDGQIRLGRLGAEAQARELID